MMKKLKKSIMILLILIVIMGTQVMTYATNIASNSEVNSRNEIIEKNIELVEDYEFSNMNTKIYLSDITPQGNNYSSYYANADSNGNKFALLKDGEEKEYEKGILTIPSNQAYLIYTDIQEQGYRFFSADIGINKTGRQSNSSVKFTVYADDVEVYSSEDMSSTDELKNIVVPLKDVKVLKIAVTTVSGSNPHAVWGDAAFYKEAETPYLAVDDLEFNLAEQVTASNILEYAIAKDKEENDITKDIKYETDYKDEESGTFKVLYSVTDKNGNTHKRIVNMTITGEDYSKELSIERLKKPWASYLYHGRGTLSTQGKKSWDIVLKEVLDFDPSKWNKITKYGEGVYQVDIDLQANGIYVKKAELTSLIPMLMDDEPRTFVMKDWGTGITEKDGLVSHVTVWVNKEGEKQDEWLAKIEANTVNMLSEKKDDMTEVQRLKVVVDKYKSWLVYADGGQLLSNSLGNGRAVCGGNARGYIYLSQRLGTKSVWGRSAPHAWSFTKTYEYDYWFKTDLLSGEFLAPGVNGEGNLSVGGNYKARHYKWFVFGTEEYPRKLLNYPSVWVTVSSPDVFIPKNREYNLLDYIVDYGSIFTEEFPKENISVKIDRITKNQEVVKTDIKDFPTSGDGTNLKAGFYHVNYFITDKGKTNSASLVLRVTNGTETDPTVEESEMTGTVNKVESLGLWTGEAERYYTNAIEAKENASITFDITDKGYKYLEFDYGIKDSVRENTQYGMNGKVQAVVHADDKIIYEGAVLGWQTKYESISLAIPDGTKTIKIESKAVGAGNNHAGICNLRFITDDGSNDFKEANIVEMPQKITANIGEKVTITPTIEESDGRDEYQWYKNGEKLNEQTEPELVLETMNLEDEGNYTLTITSTLENEKKEVTSPVCQVLATNFEISSEKYTVEEATISKIPPQTTVNDFKENVKAGEEITIKNADGELLQDTDVLTTGTTIKTGEDIEYTVCITGDMDKDGKATVNDLSLIKLHFIKKENLEGITLKAANIDEDEKITINDIACLKLVLIKKMTIE